jgi:hypothetical protein
MLRSIQRGIRNRLFPTDHIVRFQFYLMSKTKSNVVHRYTLEILPFALRAKGFTVFGFALSLSLVFNQYVNPIALKALGWKYYV